MTDRKPVSEMTRPEVLEAVIDCAEHSDAVAEPQRGFTPYSKFITECIEDLRAQPTKADILEWCEQHEDMFMDSGTDSNHGEHTSWERFDPQHAAYLLRHVMINGLVPYTGEDYARDRETWHSGD